MAAPVVHFEVHADDRPALAAFYERVFGWKTMAAPGMPYTLLFPTGGGEPGQPQPVGIGGGMMDRQGPRPEAGAPVNGFVCVLEVADLDASHQAVLANGGATALEPFDVEGVGRVFYFHDPAGNIVGCMQPVSA